MELLKGNIATLLKLLILFYCVPMFLVSFGGEVLTVVHVINKIPSSVTSGLSSFQKLYGCPLIQQYVCFLVMVMVRKDIIIMILSYTIFIFSF